MRKLKYIIRDIPFRIRLIKWSLERAYKGYTTWDIMGPGFDSTHAKYIGHSLLYMAQHSHSYPGVEPYNDPEKWIADLTKHGQALVDLSKDPEFTKVESNYLDNIWTKEDEDGHSKVMFPEKSEQYKIDSAARIALEKQRNEDATAALHWIADWHSSLWD